MKNEIILIVLGILGWACWVVALLQLLQVGSPLNNSYLYADNESRKTMEKKPLFRQAAVTFFLIGAAFGADMLAILLEQKWIYGVVAVIIVGLLAYSVASSVQMEKRQKQTAAEQQEAEPKEEVKK